MESIDGSNHPYGSIETDVSIETDGWRQELIIECQRCDEKRCALLNVLPVVGGSREGLDPVEDQ